jgi:hypothetical protein
MVLEAITIAQLVGITKIISFITGFGGLLFGVFKVINWIKSKLTNIDSNVVELKKTFESNMAGLREDIKSQTTTLATALSEQRADFRTFYAPTLLMMQQQQLQEPLPVRAKRPIRKKKPAR